MVPLTIITSLPLTVMLNKLERKLGDKQGSSHSSATEIEVTVALTTFIALTATNRNMKYININCNNQLCTSYIVHMYVLTQENNNSNNM